ncbi:hypothetical protein ABK040_010506 [Willaertia magna]
MSLNEEIEYRFEDEDDNIVAKEDEATITSFRKDKTGRTTNIDDDEEDIDLEELERMELESAVQDEQDEHFNETMKPQINDTIQFLTNFYLFKDDPTLSSTDNTRIYTKKRLDCLHSLQILQSLLVDDILTIERKSWCYLIQNKKIYINELSQLIQSFRDDFELMKEILELLILLSSLPDQVNPRFRKFTTKGSAEEKKVAHYNFNIQIKLLRNLKQGILDYHLIKFFIWILMKREYANLSNGNLQNNSLQKDEVDQFCLSLFLFLNNLLSIPDANSNTILQSEASQANMQDTIIKQLQNECYFFDYAIAIVTKYVEKYDSVRNTSIMLKNKWLTKWYLTLLKFISLICWNESPTRLFANQLQLDNVNNNNNIHNNKRDKNNNSSNNNSGGDVEMVEVMQQMGREGEVENSELKRLLRREKMFKSQVKSMIIPTRHSRFGTLFERNSVVSSTMKENRKKQQQNKETNEKETNKEDKETNKEDKETTKENKEDKEEEEENNKEEKEEENVFVDNNNFRVPGKFMVSNYSQFKTANNYLLVDNPFLIGGGSQRASSENGKRVGSRRYNVVSDNREMNFNSFSVETRKIIKHFVDNLHRGCFNYFIGYVWEAICKQQEDSIAIVNTLETTKSTKEILDRESERYFLFLSQFMMEYTRCKLLYKRSKNNNQEVNNYDISYISNILKDKVIIELFRRLLSDYINMQHYLNLYYIVCFLKELFITFSWMCDKNYSGTNSVEWGRIVSIHLHHLLFDPTNIENIIKLVRDYRPYNNSLKYLSQLILFIDIYIKVINDSSSIESFFIKKKKKGDNTTEEDNEEEEFTHQEDIASSQRRFELEGLKRKLSSPSVIKQYMYLFRFYDINSPDVNLSILRVFKEIVTEENEMQFMLFRASFLKLCFTILSNKSFTQDTTISEYERKVNLQIVEYIVQLVSEFFRKVDEDIFTTVESLHWNTKGTVSLLNLGSNKRRECNNGRRRDKSFIVENEESDDEEKSEEEEEFKEEKEPPKKKNKKKEKKEEKELNDEEEGEKVEKTPPKKLNRLKRRVSFASHATMYSISPKKDSDSEEEHGNSPSQSL